MQLQKTHMTHNRYTVAIFHDCTQASRKVYKLTCDDNAFAHIFCTKRSTNNDENTQ